MNLLENFSIAEEFPIAWTYLALDSLGVDVPLHVLCVLVMAAFASLVAAGVYGLSLELTGRIPLALGAAAFHSVLPANYRTLGFVLIREDFALPWFALHLYLLARAVRLRTRVSFLLAALAATVAVSSWHAMGFVVTIEVLCLWAWFARTGENPFAVRGAWVVPVTLAVLSFAVPLLRSKWFVLSLPMQLVFSLWVAHAFDPSGRRTRPVRVGVALASFAALLALSFGASSWLGAGLGDYGHVFELVLAKVRHLGVRPEDPAEMPFGARLLWQGPFDTMDSTQLYRSLVAGVALIAVAAIGSPLLALFTRRPVGWLRRDDPAFALVTAFCVAGLGAALMIQRNVVLPGLATPVLGALMLARVRPPALGVALMLAGIAAQGVYFQALLANHTLVWYQPAARNAELARLVHWLDEHPDSVPADEAIVADFVNSTAILAHTRHPIVLQPKYETLEARRRAEEFGNAIIWGTPDDVRRYMTRYDAHFLMVDRHLVWRAFGYPAGVPLTAQPLDRSAIAAFRSDDPAVLENLPGYRLLYRSDPRSAYDQFRLFAVEPLE